MPVPQTANFYVVAAGVVGVCAIAATPLYLKSMRDKELLLAQARCVPATAPSAYLTYSFP